MGPYCRYCDQRCFVERRLPDDANGRPSEIVNLATCAAGAEFDRQMTGYNFRTAINPRALIPRLRATMTRWAELDDPNEYSEESMAAAVMHDTANEILTNVDTLWGELVAAHLADRDIDTLERRQMARTYRNGMVAAYATVTGQSEETVMEELDQAVTAAHEQAMAEV